MAVQLIKDDNGKTQYVVIPYDEYFRMCLQMAEIDDETDDDFVVGGRRNVGQVVAATAVIF